MRRFWWLVPIIVGGVVVGWVPVRGMRYEEPKVELPGGMDAPPDHNEQGDVRVLPGPCRGC